MNEHKKYLQMAIEEGRKGMEADQGGPFGAVIIKDGKVIGRGNNRVTSSNDPTAHAEVVAIREACSHLESFQLDDCILYASCEPCPMCLGAIYWARPDKVYFAASKTDAADAGFDDDFIYQELDLPPKDRTIPMIQDRSEESLELFQDWIKKEDKVEY